MRILLHVGMHKTGTTSLQVWLDEHKAGLAEAGIRAYPAETAVAAQNPLLFEPEKLAAQAARAEAEGVELLIYSREAISTFSGAQIATLCQALGPYPISAVVTFRHWLGFLRSRWGQNAKRRDAQSLPRFLARMRAAEGQRFDISFERVLGALAEGGVDRVKAVSYDNALRQGGVLPVVLGAMGLPEALLGRAAGEARRHGESAGIAELDRHRLFNGALAEARGLAPDGLFEAFGAHRPASEFFDLWRKSALPRSLARMPELVAEIDRHLASRQEVVRLSQADFAALEARLAEAIGDNLVNPLDGRLFPALKPVEIACSALEAEELPAELRARMADIAARAADHAAGRGLGQRLKRIFWRARRNLAE